MTELPIGPDAPRVPPTKYTDEEREQALHRARGDMRQIRVYLEESIENLKRVEVELRHLQSDPEAKRP